MQIRNRETAAVIEIEEFFASYPYTSFPSDISEDILDSYGYDKILEGVSCKVVPPYGISIRDGVEQIDGDWYSRYIAGPIFDNEEDEKAYRLNIDIQASGDIIKTRNSLISKSDWMGCSDVIMSDEWREYRQELRDITTQEGFPHNVDWPEEPGH